MKTIKFLLAILVSIAIAACGGGGGSSAPATYAISGTVSGSATSGVTIALTGTSSASTTTDATGNYSFTGLANGSYTVTPTKAGNAFNPTSTAVAVSGANVTGTNFVATAAATTYSISGTVSGAATSGVTITLSGSNTGSMQTVTGGTYTFTGLVAGNYTVTASLTGFTFTAPVSIAALAANSTGNNFTATAVPVPHSISGTVSPSLSGVTISVTGTANATATTGAGGAYTVTGLYDGSYTVTPTLTNYTFNPVSISSVAVSGANVTGQNFTGTANSAVQAVVSGSVSGFWTQGVTLTLSGGTTGTQSTNVSGNYSFSLASGQSYTLTPSLPGYTFSPASVNVTVPAGSSTAITGNNFVSSSAIASFSISGSVTYPVGTHTGPIGVRVYDNNCTNCSTVGGAVLAAPGTYTIRGLQNGNYTVVAEMDTLGSGLPNANNPMGTSPATIASNNPTVNVVVADPAAVTPVTPTIDAVSPGNGSAFVAYTPPVDANSQEIATSYKVSWGTDTAASTGGGNATFAANGTNGNVYIVSGLTNTAVLYFKLTALVGATPSAASTVFGPVTIGTPTGGHSVSGTVTSPGATAPVPMYVGLYSNSGIYFTKVVGPASSQSYSIAGVADGSYFPFAIIDMNNNGVIDLGDISNTNGNGGGLLTVSGSNVTGNNIALPTGSATFTVNTDRQYDGATSNYTLILGISDGTKHAVAETLISGPNVAVPADMSLDSGYDRWMWLGTTSPTVGDTYVFNVTYSDGSTGTLTSSVTAVLGTSQMAQNLLPKSDGTGGSSATVPLFTWAAPSSPPTAFTYTYRVHLQGNNTNWDYPQDNGMPSTTTPLQVLYNADGRASGPLTAGFGYSYSWQVQVKDANGNSATRTATYTVP